MVLVWIQIFKTKKESKGKNTKQLFINNNARFCFQSKGKVLSSSGLGRMQIWTKKDKNWKSYWCDLEKSVSDSEANKGYNDETEFDCESTNNLVKAKKVF